MFVSFLSLSSRFSCLSCVYFPLSFLCLVSFFYSITSRNKLIIIRNHFVSLLRDSKEDWMQITPKSLSLCFNRSFISQENKMHGGRKRRRREGEERKEEEAKEGRMKVQETSNSRNWWIQVKEKREVGMKKESQILLFLQFLFEFPSKETEERHPSRHSSFSLTLFTKGWSMKTKKKKKEYKSRKKRWRWRRRKRHQRWRLIEQEEVKHTEREREPYTTQNDMKLPYFLISDGIHNDAHSWSCLASLSVSCYPHPMLSSWPERLVLYAFRCRRCDWGIKNK